MPLSSFTSAACGSNDGGAELCRHQEAEQEKQASYAVELPHNDSLPYRTATNDPLDLPLMKLWICTEA
jgi:hypothetical protein